jgi:hypothetical protein
MSETTVEPRPRMPRAQRIYGETIYWFAIGAAVLCMIGPLVAMTAPSNNVIDPRFLFSAIFEGKSAEEIWAMSDDGTRGGHFWMQRPTAGDGLTQLGLVIGCSCALWGLLAAAVCYLVDRPRTILYAALAVWVGLLIALSATGAVSGGH